MENPHGELDGLIKEIRDLGTAVETGPVSTADDIAKMEEELGFSLTSQYRDFLTSYGRLAISDKWFFYGHGDAQAMFEDYDFVFDNVRDDAEEPEHYPARFVVVHDQGEFANRGTGVVYDADLDSLFATFGDDYNTKDEVIEQGIWEFIIDTVIEIFEEIHAANNG